MVHTFLTFGKVSHLYSFSEDFLLFSIWKLWERLPGLEHGWHKQEKLKIMTRERDTLNMPMEHTSSSSANSLGLAYPKWQAACWSLCSQTIHGKMAESRRKQTAVGAAPKLSCLDTCFFKGESQVENFVPRCCAFCPNNVNSLWHAILLCMLSYVWYKHASQSAFTLIFKNQVEASQLCV